MDSLSQMRMTKPTPYVVAIIQARLGSVRFPGKVLNKIGDKTMLEHVIDRVKSAGTVKDVVVATPDKRISDIASSRGAWGYWDQGDESDVLTRYVKAVHFSNAEVVVRITADCPFVDPEVIDRTVRGLANRDFCSNVFFRTYPRGFDVEVFPRDTLHRLDRLSKGSHYREHVTLYVYDHTNLFHHKNISTDALRADINVSVDTADDLSFVRGVFHNLGSSSGYQEVIAAADEYLRASTPVRGVTISDSATIDPGTGAISNTA